MTFKHAVRLWVRKHLGVDIVRFSPTTSALAMRMQQMKVYGVNLVIDVGANAGQFAEEIRREGYQDEIISFEPLSEPFNDLNKKCIRDKKWQCRQCGVGDKKGELEINVAGNSASSSFLDMLPTHSVAAPTSGYIAKETVPIETLDDLFNECDVSAKTIWLKIDTQGYEKHVLDGGKRVLPLIETVQMELSLAALYNGQPDFSEMINFLAGYGFSLTGIVQGFTNPKSGRVLQVDGIFHRERNTNTY